MIKNREETQNFILEWITKIAPSGENTKLYVDLFASMDDQAFTLFMDNLKNAVSSLAVIVPNFGSTGVTTENNLKLAKELGHNFFQRVYMPAIGDSPAYLTPIPYLVVMLPLRRQAQLQIKKRSIPEDNKSVDDFTGQPTGRSQGSKISYPETQVLRAMGLDKCIVEFLKYRGGDVKGFDAMNNAISKTGGVRMDAIEHLSSGVESTRTLQTYLRSMHLENNLL